MIYTAEILPNRSKMPRVCDFVEIPEEHFKAASLRRMMTTCKDEVHKAVHYVNQISNPKQSVVGLFQQFVHATSKDVLPHWFLAGGALASLLQKVDPKDFDLFFSQAEFPEALWNAGYATKTKWSITHDKMQFVRAFTGKPDQVVSNFDFVHCQFYVDSGRPNTLLGTYEAVECVQCRKLVYLGSQFPVRAFMRMKKFIERGWHVDQENYDKIIADCAKVNIDKIEFGGMGENIKEQLESDGES